MTRRGIAIATVLLLAAACGGSSTSAASTPTAITDVSEVHVFEASVEEFPKGVGQVVAALHNAADGNDALVSVTCSCGGTATLYEAGATKAASSIALPSQKVVLFGPKGDRIELTDLTTPLSSVTTVDLTFTFAHATQAEATAAISLPGTPSPAA